MPRTSTQTAGESREKSTTAAGSAFPPTPRTAAGSLQSCHGPPDHAQSFASATATLAAPSPIPKPVPAGSYSQSPKASALPEKPQSHPAMEEETFQEIAQTHG